MPFVTVDGIRIHYVEAGSREPALLFLHAFPLDDRMWEPQLVHFGTSRRVVAPDLMGFGRSDAPDHPDAYRMEVHADQVAELIEALGLAPVVLVGLSMGGYVAFSLLRRHRELLAGLVLADTRAATDSPEVLERRTKQQGQIAESGKADVIDALIKGLLSESTLADRPDVVDTVRRLMDQPPAGFVGGLEAMKRRPDAVEELAGIDLPTLVLVGEHDVPSPPDVAASMAERLPNARLEVLPGAGHLSNIEASENFNRALDSFLVTL